jgi:hypothetical protein
MEDGKHPLAAEATNSLEKIGRKKIRGIFSGVVGHGGMVAERSEGVKRIVREAGRSRVKRGEVERKGGASERSEGARSEMGRVGSNLPGSWGRAGAMGAKRGRAGSWGRKGAERADVRVKYFFVFIFIWGFNCCTSVWGGLKYRGVPGVSGRSC